MKDYMLNFIYKGGTVMVSDGNPRSISHNSFITDRILGRA